MSDHLIGLLRAEKAAAVLGSHSFAGDATVLVRREHLLDVAALLRDDPRFAMNMLIDVTGTDFLTFPAELRSAVSPVDAESGLDPEDLPRFEVVYHFLSLQHRHRLRLKVMASEDDLNVPSLTPLWIAANWGEREVWDMYGVRFDGHPELRRVLMYEEFEGHPLRKDYPLRGYQPLVQMPDLADYDKTETFR
jgi:NADH-quinone oxidoreductase subunit C